MNPVELTLRILECHTSRAGLREAAELLSATIPLRGLFWLAADGSVREVFPAGQIPDPNILQTASAGERFELHRSGEGDQLIVPLPGTAGTLLLLAPAGTLPEIKLDEDSAAWGRAARAFSMLVEREEKDRAQAAEREALRQRAEESEALHALGLSTNRSLDPAEVLELVARVARTLLGAEYVTVSTLRDDEVSSVAAAGLRAEQGSADSDSLAARVIARGMPITVGQDDSSGSPEDYPFHRREGMQAALGVPLSLFGTTFGALVAGYRRPYVLTRRDTRFALTLAGHAAVAINNAQLHSAIAERSEELERAYQELSWTSQSKERFFASMSHELRTPLNAVLGYQSLLLQEVPGPLPTHVRPFLEKAHRASRNLLTLVNDVLDLAKIEAGKVELVFRPADLREVIDDAVLNVQPEASAKGLSIAVAIDPEVRSIESDPDRVGQILRNLLSNAVKFTERGQIRITVGQILFGERGAGDQPPPEWVEISVHDRGRGIPPEDLERIFHEFEQVTGSGSRGGTGLGLPISRKLARLLGGELAVESRFGEGSTFLLRLPVVPPTLIGTAIADPPRLDHPHGH